MGRMGKGTRVMGFVAVVAAVVSIGNLASANTDYRVMLPEADRTVVEDGRGAVGLIPPVVIEASEWVTLPALDCDAVPDGWVEAMIGEGRGPRVNEATGWGNVEPADHEGSGEAIYHYGNRVAVTFAC